jgi:flagellar basal-body rod modification protein FlgD
MDINAISSATTKTNSGTNTLGDSDMFLTLLLAELQTQDPLSPMDTEAMVTQLSTIQMVAENRAMRLSQQFMQACGLLGKEVSWQEATGESRSGAVTRVTREQSEPRLVVGDTVLTVDQIQSISS